MAHTHEASGATPDPATGAKERASDGRIAFLQDLSVWMRDVGATRVRLPDGLELELGDRPPTPQTKETTEQARARQRSALREELDIRYAHVGGWPGSDDELDDMLDARRA